MGALFLTERDRDLLQQLLIQTRQERQNVLRHEGEAGDYLPPEVYVAKVPDEGLPGLTSAESEEGYDQPGMVACDIWRIILDSEGNPELHDADFEQDVYNIGTAISAGWIVVQRTKFGYWTPVVGGSELRPFELKTELLQGLSATAHPLTWDDDAGAWTPDLTEANEFIVWDDLSKNWGWARSAGNYPGARGVAAILAAGAGYTVIEIVQMADQICGTLTEDMGYTVAGRASCTIDDHYRGTSPLYIAASVNVHDPQGLFPRALSGAKFKATWDNRSQQYHLQECQQMCMKMRGTITGTLEEDDANITVTGLHIMQPFTGQAPDPLPATVPNTLNWAGSNGGIIIIDWDEGQETPGWIPSQLECP